MKLCPEYCTHRKHFVNLSKYFEKNILKIV